MVATLRVFSRAPRPAVPWRRRIRGVCHRRSSLTPGSPATAEISYVVSEPPLDREARRRLAIIRHVEEVSGNVALPCRYYGIHRQGLVGRGRYGLPL